MEALHRALSAQPSVHGYLIEGQALQSKAYISKKDDEKREILNQSAIAYRSAIRLSNRTSSIAYLRLAGVLADLDLYPMRKLISRAPFS
jgi:hypothetical protein